MPDGSLGVAIGERMNGPATTTWSLMSRDGELLRPWHTLPADGYCDYGSQHIASIGSTLLLSRPHCDFDGYDRTNIHHAVKVDHLAGPEPWSRVLDGAGECGGASAGPIHPSARGFAALTSGACARGVYLTVGDPGGDHLSKPASITQHLASELGFGRPINPTFVPRGAGFCVAFSTSDFRFVEAGEQKEPAQIWLVELDAALDVIDSRRLDAVPWGDGELSDVQLLVVDGAPLAVWGVRTEPAGNFRVKLWRACP
jgi:hypothetical protein